jgi:hypothetical protein
MDSGGVGRGPFSVSRISRDAAQGECHSPMRRDRHIQAIAETGRMAWQTVSGHIQRAKGRLGAGSPNTVRVA